MQEVILKNRDGDKQTFSFENGVKLLAPDGTLLPFVTGGGAGGSIKVAGGAYTPPASSTTHTIEHNLGVVPDLIVAWTYSLTNSGYKAFIGVSEKAAELFGITEKKVIAYGTGGNYICTYIDDKGVERTNAIISSVTENTFTIGVSAAAVKTTKYNWFVMGGLS